GEALGNLQRTRLEAFNGPGLSFTLHPVALPAAQAERHIAHREGLYLSRSHADQGKVPTLQHQFDGALPTGDLAVAVVARRQVEVAGVNVHLIRPGALSGLC